MQTVRAIPRGTGDYVHPEECVRILDEATGDFYDLILKGEALRSDENGTVHLYIPAGAIIDLAWEGGYCVVKLSKAPGGVNAVDAERLRAAAQARGSRRPK